MVYKSKKLLLIFIKNPEPGKVKTRLAKTVGKNKAYQVYLDLLSHSITVAKKVDSVRQVWYSSFIDRDDEIAENTFQKFIQKGSDLGERMEYAFAQGFKNGYEKIVIIGSDCPGITASIIEDAYKMLDDCDVVLGPSEDGGYYLLGMRQFNPELFSNIEWSTERVLQQTGFAIQKKGLAWHQLPVLNDIDTEEDLRKSSLG
jgi:uncharacterized protein